jgi:ankyrin repeat protein
MSSKNKMSSQEEINGLVELARKGDAAAVADFLDKHAAVINERDGKGFTALIVAAGWERWDVIKLLLKRGADIEATDKEGRTALMIEARYGHRKSVEFLLENGASVSKKDDEGRTTLDHARENCKPHIEEVLELYTQELAEEIKNFVPALKREMPAPRLLKPFRPRL